MSRLQEWPCPSPSPPAQLSHVTVLLTYIRHVPPCTALRGMWLELSIKAPWVTKKVRAGLILQLSKRRTNSLEVHMNWISSRWMSSRMLSGQDLLSVLLHFSAVNFITCAFFFPPPCAVLFKRCHPAYHIDFCAPALFLPVLSNKQISLPDFTIFPLGH